MITFNLSDKNQTMKSIYPLQKNTNHKEILLESLKPDGPKLPTKSDKKVFGNSISARLGINNKTDHSALNDLTHHDGSEDPGSGLDTEFSNIANKENQKSP